MSAHLNMARLTVRDIQALKDKQQPIVCLTAYAANMARLLDPHIDLFIVGDSLAMVLYGEPSTLNVPLEVMIRHARSVTQATYHAMIVVDMPFGSYQQNPELAFANAAKLLAESGAQAIKLEGGHEMVETVRFLVDRGIPVMAHLGLMPQHVHRMGGYKAQGKTDNAAQDLLAQATAFEKAGAFALLLEGIYQPAAESITNACHIPTIGIGASVACDGQVLVTDDMLGLHATTPKFVKRYADLGNAIANAVSEYARDVKERKFPEDQHSFISKS